mgnify:CR=1 FL=1
MATTVAWMLSAFATLIAQVLALIAWSLVSALVSDTSPSLLLPLPGLLLFVAILSGLVCLILTAVVYKVRDIPPPRTVTAGALVISLTPYAALLALWLKQGA